MMCSGAFDDSRRFAGRNGWPIRLAARDEECPQIEQRMQLEGCFGRTERRPWKNRQTQIDGRYVERVNRLGEIQAKRLLGVQAARDTNQPHGEARVDTPIARRIGVGESVAGNGAANPQVLELCGLCSQARLDVARLSR
jgi:hypothetical protein